MDDNELMSTQLRPTATRPLLGLTILVVEDSRYSCDAMRLLCLRSGARIRRADCLRSARRHLRVYRPSVVVVDLGLPDGSGAELISELSVACPRVDVILGTSGDSFAEDVALAAGADGFLAKPVSSVLGFQNAILSVLPPERRPLGPRMVNDDPVLPDPLAYRDDMAHAADVMTEAGNDDMLAYLAQFITGVARSAGDGVLQKAAEDLAEARADRRDMGTTLARVSALVQDRLADRLAI